MVQRLASVLLLLSWSMQPCTAQSPQPAPAPQDAQPTAPIEMRTTFRVRYINGGNVYVEGGRSAGLAEGTRLVIDQGQHSPADTAAQDQATNDSSSADEPSGLIVVAEMKVVAVAETSAVCEVISSTRPLVAGDIAMLPAGGSRETCGEACAGQHAELSCGRQLHRRRPHG